MRRGGLLLLGLFLLGGCRHEDLRARYQAERARYWAERSEIRFSLEVDPRVRRRHYETALRYLEVAQLSDPSTLSSTPGEGVAEDLRRMHSQARLRAGARFLEAGRFDLAEAQLAWVQAHGVGLDPLRAAWLRAGSAWGRELWEESVERYVEVFRLQSRQNPRPPEEGLLEEPVARAFQLRSVGQDFLVGRITAAGRRFYDAVEERWPDRPEAARAAFLRHRLAVAARDWPAALAALDHYESLDLSEVDRWNARFNRAEILLAGTEDLAGADSLFAAVASQSVRPALASLARLRRTEVIGLRRGPEAALEALEALEEPLHEYPELAASALLRVSDLRLDSGDLVGATQALRRLRLRYPDTPAGLEAPQRLVEVAERSGQAGALQNALSRAEEEYRRQLAGHAVDGPVGLSSRRSLIATLLRQGEWQEALLELEQLYHVLGATPGGARALLQAAEVARGKAEDPGLARRYLERVVEEVPATREGLRARQMLSEMGSAIDSPGQRP